jgi:hypothetical protein
MTDDEFWQLIDKTRAAGDPELQATALEDALSRLTPKEIVAFEQIFWRLHARAYHYALWGAAYVLNGGCSDDSFSYFRNWLIGRGRDVYERALTDPDSLADFVGVSEIFEAEELMNVAEDAFERKTGKRWESLSKTDLRKLGWKSESPASSEPGGQPWTEDQLVSLYPRIAARQGRSS